MGTTVIVAGNFVRIGGLPRDGLAAIDTRTGKVKPWDPQLGIPGVDALLATGSTLYVAGGFDEHLAAFPLAEVTRSTL